MASRGEQQAKRKRRRKVRKKRGVAEIGWGRQRRRHWRVLRNWIGLAIVLLAAVLLVGLVKVWSSTKGAGSLALAAGGNREEESPEVHIKAELEEAEEVAVAFLSEPDPEKRLRWVRDAEAVRGRLGEYQNAARSEPGEIDKVIGHNETATAFAVTLPSGEIRLLEVVDTPEGLKVDWDAYARYGTASWEDLWSGKAQRAVVRVFCEPATEAPEPFEEREKWTAFRLSSPDLPQVALGFAKTGTVREAMMKKVVLGSPRYRQRFVLEVERYEGHDEPLFEITRCLAVGWVLNERPVEEVWAEEMAAAAE